MFDRKGVIVIEKADSVDEDTLMMDALEAGADDFNVEDECYEIMTAVETFSEVRETLEKAGYTFAQAELNYVPQTTTVLDDEEAVKKMGKLIDMLEENDDVQNVYHTWDMPDDEQEKSGISRVSEILIFEKFSLMMIYVPLLRRT